MLIDFSVENYKSIKDTLSLNMEMAVPSDVPDVYEGQINRIDVNVVNDGKEKVWKYCSVSPIMALFGANASGKSNVFKALIAMRAIVMGGKVEDYYNPYKLDKKTKGGVTKFSVVFEKDGFVYSYAIAFGSNYVDNESLYWWEKPNAKKRKIFDLSGEKFNEIGVLPRHLADCVISRSSMLSVLYLHGDVEEKFYSHIKRVRDFFADDIVVAEDVDRFALGSDEQVAQRDVDIVRSLMNSMDVQCDKIVLNRRLKKKILDNSLTDISEIEKIRADVQTDGALVSVDCEAGVIYADEILLEYGEQKMNLMVDESTGTRNIFRLLLAVIEGLRRGKIFVFDEIDRTIHTELIKFLFALVKAEGLNKNGGQMLCSSHNPCVMLGLGLFEIALVDKIKNATVVRYASEYDYGKKDVSVNDVFDNYMLGVIGGMPRVVGIYEGMEI